MTDARNNILANLKTKKLKKDLILPLVIPHELLERKDLILHCKRKLEHCHASVDVIHSHDEFLDSIIQFLCQWSPQRKLKATKAVWPGLVTLMKNNKLLSNRSIGQNQTVITQAAIGVAETGSLLLPSSPERPTLANFLPQNSIVIIDVENIVWSLEQGLQCVQSSDSGMPRALNLVSGPSKTADIEQTLVYGAHGPKRLHVLIMQNDDR